MKVKALVMSNSLWSQGFLPLEFSRQEYLSDKHSLCKGIFLIQGLNPSLHITGRFFIVKATYGKLHMGPQKFPNIESNPEKEQN